MEKKIGVYICGGCGIGEAIDVEKLAETAKSEFKAPVFVHPFLCGAEGVGQIRADIEAGKVNAPVIAACSSRAKGEVFAFDPRTTVLDRVNLREQVAWSHEPSLAEGQTFDEDIRMLAEDQLRMGVARVRNIDPPEPYIAECTKRILVVGGGATGMTSAIEAARAGYEVVLVEKEPGLGGFALKLFKEYPKVPPFREPVPPDCGSLIDALAKEPRVKVLTSAAVEKIEGAPGMFEASIRQNGNVLSERIGAVVLATGFVPYDAANLGHLGFGASPNVVTTVAMEEMARRGELVRPSDGKAARSVAFILCAGSRDVGHLPYCSSTCCLTSLKQALYVRELRSGGAGLRLLQGHPHTRAVREFLPPCPGG